MASESFKTKKLTSWFSTRFSLRGIHRVFRTSILGGGLDLSEYFAYRGFQLFCKSAPRDTLSTVGNHIGSICWQTLSRARNICERNLCLAANLSGSNDRVRELTGKVFKFWATAFVEFLWLQDRIQPGTWQNYISVDGLHHLRAARKKGNGVIIAAPHMGNWEFIGQALAILDYPIVSVARNRQKKSRIDRHIHMWRKKFGQEIIFEEDSPREFLSVLREGKFLGLVSDQYAGRNGIFCEFFGALASHKPGAAVLSHHLDTPVVPACCYRESDRMHYHVKFGRPLVPEENGNLETKKRRMTEKLVHRFERFIRSHPEQWLWLHRKWRKKWLETRPTFWPN